MWLTQKRDEDEDEEEHTGKPKLTEKKFIIWSKNRNQNYPHSLGILNWGSALSSSLNWPIKVKSPQIKGGEEPGMKERLLKALFSRVSPEITQPTQTEISEKLTAGLSIVWPASRETWRANGCHKLYSRSVRQDVQDRCCLHMFGFINLQSEDAAWVWKASSKSQY